MEQRLKDLESYQAIVVTSFLFDGREASRFEIAVIARPRERKYRWEYRTPLKGHIFVSDGLSSWYYDADKGVVTTGYASPYPMGEWFHALFSTPEGFVRSLDGEEEVAGRRAYVVRLRPESGAPTDLKIPKGTGTFTSSDVLQVTYWIDREELFPLRIEERGIQESVMLTEYRELRLDAETPQHLFQRPEGAGPPADDVEGGGKR
ncbi:MAG: outer membrane lipoprotein carrier protein LolA [Chloroflexi bacterium]|nr:outer membrane lipoprotein carrier protein LolA [Chloroflexota bacterium]